MFYSSYIYLDAHLLILIISATMGAICFWVVELWGKIQEPQEKSSLKQKNLLARESEWRC